MNTSIFLTRNLACLSLIGFLGASLSGCNNNNDNNSLNTLLGNDNNNAANAFVQPQDNAQAGGGRDQTLQFGDTLTGGTGPDLLIGAIGTDFLIGNGGDDVLVGGAEDFNPQNRDRVFGGAGNDTFIWSPGDGSDFYDGGTGEQDVLIFGLLGEDDGSNTPRFAVDQDQQFDGLFLTDGLPVVDVSNSPGFCQVIDDASSATAANDLDNLNLDHLARFFIRAAADSFAANTQNTDNGLRVTLSIRNVEFLVCTERNGGQIEVLNLTTAPPTIAAVADLPERIQALIQ